MLSLDNKFEQKLDFNPFLPAKTLCTKIHLNGFCALCSKIFHNGLS